MKKLLFALCLACSAAFSQPIILSFTPDVFCPGDEICIRVYNPAHEAFYFNIEAPNTLYWWEFFPSSDDPDVSVYCFVTPNDGTFEQGIGFIGINLESQFQILIACDDPVGLSETKWREIPGESKFYDLTGQPCEFKRGELLIEEKGRHRRKIIFE